MGCCVLSCLKCDKQGYSASLFSGDLLVQQGFLFRKTDLSTNNFPFFLALCVEQRRFFISHWRCRLSGFLPRQVICILAQNYYVFNHPPPSTKANTLVICKTLPTDKRYSMHIFLNFHISLYYQQYDHFRNQLSTITTSAFTISITNIITFLIRLPLLLIWIVVLLLFYSFTLLLFVRTTT